MFTPEMLKMASSMMSNLSPDELSEMTKLAGNMQAGSSGTAPAPGNLPSDPNVMRNMLKVCPQILYMATESYSI